MGVVNGPGLLPRLRTIALQILNGVKTGLWHFLLLPDTIKEACLPSDETMNHFRDDVIARITGMLAQLVPVIGYLEKGMGSIAKQCTHINNVMPSLQPLFSDPSTESDHNNQAAERTSMMIRDRFRMLEDPVYKRQKLIIRRSVQQSHSLRSEKILAGHAARLRALRQDVNKLSATVQTASKLVRYLEQRLKGSNTMIEVEDLQANKTRRSPVATHEISSKAKVNHPASTNENTESNDLLALSTSPLDTLISTSRILFSAVGSLIRSGWGLEQIRDLHAALARPDQQPADNGIIVTAADILLNLLNSDLNTGQVNTFFALLACEERHPGVAIFTHQMLATLHQDLDVLELFRKSL